VDPVSLTLPTGPDKIRPQDREGFAKHAAPQAIRWHLDKAREELRRQQRYALWLTDLLIDRLAEVADGTWPPKKSLAEDAESAKIAAVVEAATAWRAQRNFEYRPGEVNFHLVTAHHEDLRLAHAVDALTLQTVPTQPEGISQ
jgi:hypothetical protein